MPSSFLPRHSREEEKRGTNSLIVIVCSGRVWLQHKASCYHGHGYANRLSSLQGLHYCYPTRLDLQRGIHLVRECPTEAIRYTKVHPSSSTERPSAGLILSTKELWTPILCTPARCVAGR